MIALSYFAGIFSCVYFMKSCINEGIVWDICGMVSGLYICCGICYEKYIFSMVCMYNFSQYLFCSNVWSCLHKDIRQHKKQDGCLVIAVTVDNSSLGSFTYICDVIYVFLYFVK